jgi:hypothetical protein
MESAPAVLVVPVTVAAEVVLIRQFRYACNAEVVAVPAGTRGDQEDASLEQVTRRESQQEIGAMTAAYGAHNGPGAGHE